jgi:hypothetical protein
LQRRPILQLVSLHAHVLDDVFVHVQKWDWLETLFQAKFENIAKLKWSWSFWVWKWVFSTHNFKIELKLMVKNYWPSCWTLHKRWLKAKKVENFYIQSGLWNLIILTKNQSNWWTRVQLWYTFLFWLQISIVVYVAVEQWDCNFLLWKWNFKKKRKKSIIYLTTN